MNRKKQNSEHYYKNKGGARLKEAGVPQLPTRLAEAHNPTTCEEAEGAAIIRSICEQMRKLRPCREDAVDEVETREFVFRPRFACLEVR